MKRLNSAFLLVCLSAWAAKPVATHPNYLTQFEQDLFRKPSVSGCGTCHLDAQGGGPRNAFGADFAANGFAITPILRASYPDRFDISLTAELPKGGRVYFSDPGGQFVVFERNQQKYLLDVTAVVEGRLTDRAAAESKPAPAAPPAAPKEEPKPKQHPISNFSFFVTSAGPGNGGNLGGLAGADRYCQQLATAVDAGHKTWHAYLSTSIDEGASVNAGDRIGSGPWFNAKGSMVARGVADLHSANGRLARDSALNEKGESVSQHEILTGTNPDGTSAVGMNCDNWTSSSKGTALMGHSDRQGKDGDGGTSFNSAHPSKSCSPQDLQPVTGGGLFYCFAVDVFRPKQ